MYPTKHIRIRNKALKLLGSLCQDFENSKTVSSYDLLYPNKKIIKNIKGTLFPLVLAIELFQGINNYSSEKTNAFIKKEVKQINKKRNKEGSLNYWSNTKKFTTPIFNCPDDLDDTIRFFIVLSKLKNNFLSPHELANLTQILTSIKKNEYGFYNTWVKPPDNNWNDYDIVVNCEILRFLNINKILHPNLLKSIEEAVLADNLKSKFYSNILIYYHISFIGISEKARQVVIKKIEAAKKLTIFDEIICANSLLRLGVISEKVVKIIDRIIKLETRVGWEVSMPLYTENVNKEGDIFVGSKEVARGYVAETLDLFITKINKNIYDSKDELNLHKAIIKEVEEIVDDLSQSKKNVFKNILEQDKNSHMTQSLTLLAYRWNVSSNRKVSLLEKDLGIITTLGWIAYSIFDHLIDKESDMSCQIPLAERCIRFLYLKLFNTSMTALEITEAMKFLKEIETAHYKEIQGQIPPSAQKSIGHSIGPLIIMLRNKFKTKHKFYKETKRYFRYFLTIKQLSDDLHDWEADLNANRKTPVTDHLQKILQKEKVENKLDLIRKVYAENTLLFFSKKIVKIGNLALNALSATGHHRDTFHFQQIVTRIQDGARRAILEVKTVKILTLRNLSLKK